MYYYPKYHSSIHLKYFSISDWLKNPCQILNNQLLLTKFERHLPILSEMSLFSWFIVPENQLRVF